MKKIISFAAVLSMCSALADEGGLEPKIYVDISEAAQEEAVTFDGFRTLFGVVYQYVKYRAFTANNSQDTENKMNMFSLAVNAEYARSFRNGFLVGVDIGTDISQNKKKEGSWADLNAAYDGDTSATYTVTALKNGKLETGIFTPYIALKAGYAIPRVELLAFLKAGLSRLSGTYHYTYGGAKISKVEVSKFVPHIGLGVEHKINSKWGAILEANISLHKECTKTLGGVSHKIKLGRSDIRIMGTYRMAAPK